jgi:hypothetical protein
MEAVAFGSLIDVEAAVDAGADLEAQDYWSRTAWLIALLKGDTAKAQLLLDRGANPGAVGRCGQPPIFCAIEGHHPHVLRWLLDLGADPEQADEFGTTPLMRAAEYDDLECARILLAVPVDVNEEGRTTAALDGAQSREVAMLLLEAGADPQKLSEEGRRAILGFPRDPDEKLVTASELDYRRGRTRIFGRTNPERMNQPFWESMIRAGLTGYGGRKYFGDERSRGAPTWCAHRFGQSLTFLPDGRIVQIAGEHEDHYDPDSCIYNDVFVHAPDGTIAIYGYPRQDFPPTDFHTSTLVDDAIYVIGSLGYAARTSSTARSTTTRTARPTS